MVVVSEPVSPLPDPFSGRGGGTDDGVAMGEAGRKDEGTGQHQCPIIQDWIVHHSGSTSTRSAAAVGSRHQTQGPSLDLAAGFLGAAVLVSRWYNLPLEHTRL